MHFRLCVCVGCDGKKCVEREENLKIEGEGKKDRDRYIERERER